MEVVNNKTERPLAHYRELFAQADPETLGAKGIASYNSDTKKFTIMVMGRPFFIRWPEGELLTTPIFMAPANSEGDAPDTTCDAKATPSVIARRAQAANTALNHAALEVPDISPELEILLLRIVLEGTPLPEPTRFLAYQELPKGAAYLPAFNRRCTLRLAKQFDEADQLTEACTALGAQEIDSKADAACQFEFLPNVFIQFLFWEGDDEFPAQSQILFSNNVTAFFSSEDMVVISEIIIRALSIGYVI